MTATAFHPFWVVQGDGLEGRPRPGHVSEREDRGGALEGRWVSSHDVRVGDVMCLHGRGQTVVRAVTFGDEAKTRVCNLTIPGLHTFAVGEDQILVHNTSASRLYKLVQEYDAILKSTDPLVTAAVKNQVAIDSASPRAF